MYELYEIEFFVAHAACPLKTVRERLMDLRILTVRGARGAVDSFFFPERPVRLNLSTSWVLERKQEGNVGAFSVVEELADRMILGPTVIFSGSVLQFLFENAKVMWGCNDTFFFLLGE